MVHACSTRVARPRAKAMGVGSLAKVASDSHALRNLRDVPQQHTQGLATPTYSGTCQTKIHATCPA